MSMLLAFGCTQPTTTPTTTAPATTVPTTTQPPKTTTPAEVYTIKVAGYGGPTYPLRIMQEEANKMIIERSGGRVKIDYYPDNSLIKQNTAFETVPNGVVDIAQTSPTYQPDLMGLIADLANMPFNWDEEMFAKNYRSPGNFFDFQQPYWQKNGLYLLNWGNVGGYEVASKTPIKVAADWKGKLIRTVKGFDSFVKLMGAEPSFISTAELYEAMQRGTVDGCTISMSSLRSLSIQEVAPYFTIASLTEASQPAVMSLKARERLPADIVKIIDEAYRDAEANHYVRLKDLVKQDTDFIKSSAKVKEVYILPADEKAKWASAAQAIYDDLAKKWGNEFTQFMTIRKTLFPS